jgi:hypothetical protein
LRFVAGGGKSIRDARITGVYCGIFNGANMCSIYFDKKSSSSPGCASEVQKMRMQLKVDTDIGRAMLSIALTAYAQGKIVWAIGTDTCTISWDTENLNQIFVLPSCSAIQSGDCTNLQ